jgi:hypothetical protein
VVRCGFDLKDKTEEQKNRRDEKDKKLTIPITAKKTRILESGTEI